MNKPDPRKPIPIKRRPTSSEWQTMIDKMKNISRPK